MMKAIHSRQECYNYLNRLGLFLNVEDGLRLLADALLQASGQTGWTLSEIQFEEMIHSILIDFRPFQVRYNRANHLFLVKSVIDGEVNTVDLSDF